MIDQAIISSLRQSGDVCYSLFTAPIGDIYLLGNNALLQAIIFKNSYTGRTPIDRHFEKGTPDTIRKATGVLKDYFSLSARNGSGRTVIPTAKTAGKDQTLLVKIQTIDLILDLSHFTSKQISVYRELLKIPAGTTISYGRLADRAGITGGARFIGNTMAKNYFPIIIPCHRVIKSDGSMGNYSGGIHIKKYLLDFEKKRLR
jgi:O-6-methylguanine DNA methyltransferase